MSEGAVRELERDDASRKRFLKMVGGGGAGAFALFLAACGSSDKKDSTSSSAPATTPSSGGSVKKDLEIVNYALTLEYLEADFYEKVVASGLFKGAQQDTIKMFGERRRSTSTH